MKSARAAFASSPSAVLNAGIPSPLGQISSPRRSSAAWSSMRRTSSTITTAEPSLSSVSATRWPQSSTARSVVAAENLCWFTPHCDGNERRARKLRTSYACAAVQSSPYVIDG